MPADPANPSTLHSLLTLLAQQPTPPIPAENLNVTFGMAAASLLLLTLVGLSLLVSIKWLGKILRHSHPVPRAEYGLLKVPLPLTLVITCITALLLVLVWFSPNTPPDPALATEPNATATATAADTLPTDDTQTDSENDSDKQNTNFTDAWKLLLADLVLKLTLLLSMGLIVLVASQTGRFQPDTTFPKDHEIPATSPTPLPTPELNHSPDAPSFWPDLETPASAAELLQSIPPNSTITPLTATTQPLPTPPFSLLTEFHFAAEIFLAAYLPTMLLRMLLALYIQSVTGEEAPSNPLLEMITGGAGGTLLLMIIFAGIVVAPVVEELQFRIVLLGGLIQAGFQRTAVIVSAVSFALLHGFPDGLALLPLAFALGYAYLRRQSYLTVILIHFLFNAINLGIAMLAAL